MLDGNISPVANPGGCQAATTCVRAYTAYRGNTSPGAGGETSGLAVRTTQMTLSITRRCTH